MFNYDPDEYGPLEPLWPHALVSRALAAVAALILWVALAFFWPELLMPSDLPATGDASTLTSILPWYFWPAAGLGHLLNAGLGMAVIMAGGLAMLLLPFWDKAERDYFWDRYVYSRLVLGWLMLTLFMGIWGLAA
jgi:quinol-cytochrome oxidoreductase complex cytochrome b subunit